MRSQDDEPVYTQWDDTVDYCIREDAYDNLLDDVYWEDDDEML